MTSQDSTTQRPRFKSALIGYFFGPTTVGVYRMADRLINTVIEMATRPFVINSICKTKWSMLVSVLSPGVLAGSLVLAIGLGATYLVGSIESRLNLTGLIQSHLHGSAAGFLVTVSQLGVAGGFTIASAVGLMFLLDPIVRQHILKLLDRLRSTQAQDMAPLAGPVRYANSEDPEMLRDDSMVVETVGAAK